MFKPTIRRYFEQVAIGDVGHGDHSILLNGKKRMRKSDLGLTVLVRTSVSLVRSRASTLQSPENVVANESWHGASVLQ